MNLSELIDFLNNVTTSTLDMYVNESKDIDSSKVYVLKNKGYLEEYSPEKIRYSLEGASSDAGDVAYMTASDISLVISEIERHFGKRTVIKSTEIRKWVKESLLNNGFKLVRDSYDK